MKAMALTLTGLLCIPLLVGPMPAGAAGEQQIIIDRSTRSKVLNDYVLLTRDAIQQVWRTPVALEGAGSVKGRVKVNYTLTRSGALDSVQLVESSGNPEMDKSLLHAIRSAQPFPPFPDDVRAPRIMIRANFVVADLPTAPVVMVDQPIDSPDTPAQEAAKTEKKKLLWGKPAETAAPKDSSIDAGRPMPEPPLRATKIPWGKQE